MLCCMIFYKADRLQSKALINYTLLIISLLFISASFGLTYLRHSLINQALIRAITQSITYILGITPLLFTVFLTKEQLYKTLAYYEKAMYILIGIGFIHYFFIRAGLQFAPIFRNLGDYTSENALAQFGNDEVFRIYGFSGEPKNMALYIAPYVVWKFIQIFSESTKRLRHFIELLLSSFILLHTFSSTAFISVTLSLPFALAMMYYVRRNILINIGLYLVIILGLGTIMYTQLGNSIELPQSEFINSFNERSFQRAQSELEDERTDVIVLRDFENSSIAEKITGYGPGLYVYHTAGLTFGRGFNPMQSGIVLNLVDFGVLGIFALLFLLFIALSVISRAIKQRNLTAIYFMCIGGTTFLGNCGYSMMGGSILLGMLPFLGIAYWLTSDKLTPNNQLLK